MNQLPSRFAKFIASIFLILSLTVYCGAQFPFANPFAGRSTAHSSDGSSFDLPPIFKAAQQCDDAQFAKLLKEDISSVNKTLDAATGYRFERESGYSGHDDAGIGQLKNFTLLDFAAENGCTNIIQQLLDLNADVNTFIPPIGLAAASGRLDAVRILLKAGAKPDDGLIAACDNGHADVAEALINAGANGVQERYRGQDLLANAVGKGNLEIVQVLLKMPKDPGDTYKYGYTRRHAFRTAIEKGNLDIVKAFVAASEDVSDSRDNDDRANMQDTLEQVAVEANQPEILAYLKEAKQH
jgi:ankyrin repeat protein